MFPEKQSRLQVEINTLACHFSGKLNVDKKISIFAFEQLIKWVQHIVYRLFDSVGQKFKRSVATIRRLVQKHQADH